MCTTAWKDQGNLEYKLGSVITGVITFGEWSNALGSPPRSPLLDWCLHLLLPSCWEYWPRMAHSCHCSGESPPADGSGLVQQDLGRNVSTILRWPEVNGWLTWGYRCPQGGTSHVPAFPVWSGWGQTSMEIISLLPLLTFRLLPEAFSKSLGTRILVSGCF